MYFLDKTRQPKLVGANKLLLWQIVGPLLQSKSKNYFKIAWLDWKLLQYKVGLGQRNLFSKGVLSPWGPFTNALPQQFCYLFVNRERTLHLQPYTWKIPMSLPLIAISSLTTPHTWARPIRRWWGLPWKHLTYQDWQKSEQLLLLLPTHRDRTVFHL